MSPVPRDEFARMLEGDEPSKHSRFFDLCRVGDDSVDCTEDDRVNFSLVVITSFLLYILGIADALMGAWGFFGAKMAALFGPCFLACLVGMCDSSDDKDCQKLVYKILSGLVGLAIAVLFWVQNIALLNGRWVPTNGCGYE
jgi:hypothetical protein